MSTSKQVEQLKRYKSTVLREQRKLDKCRVDRFVRNKLITEWE